MKKGMFITLYGINNIGKSTHAKLLVQRLKKSGYKARYIKYPIYNLAPTGPLLNTILRKSEKQSISEEDLQLWFILNRYQFQPTLIDWLKKGYIVVAEDYSGTGIAWGAAKGMSLITLIKLNTFLVQEDCAILMQGEREVRAQEKHHIHEQNEGLITKTTRIFSALARRFGWKIVTVAKTKEETAARIWKIVNSRL